MLKAENRLKAKSDFSYILKNGKRFRGRFLQINFLSEKDQELRAGFVVSKKVSKKAVVRNRIRRVLSHLFRELEDGSSAQVVVIVRAIPEKKMREGFREDIELWAGRFASF